MSGGRNREPLESNPVWQNLLLTEAMNRA